jgi:hypothetical protein
LTESSTDRRTEGQLSLTNTMSLRIRFVNKINYEPGLAFGEIVLDDFVENFEASLALWSADRYERQWREGVDRLLSGASRSCLITSVWDTRSEAFGFWWVLYREGDRVAVHNQLLLHEVLGKNFNPDDPYESIPDRVSVSADGEQISEWFLAFDEIQPI